jgi:short subunit dehydrogenase-like uncharacterized protein
MPDREYDIVVFGATGFTGALTAEYLAANAPAETRWAIAGRNRNKCESVRERLQKDDIPIVEADTNDPKSLQQLAESTKVVITTVGPYIVYGEPLVAACANAGTAYLDLTGEPEFVDRMWLGYHERAEQTGARLVHSAGFDSIPYDLGALYTVKQLPEDAPIGLEGYVRAGAMFSGGTYHSAIHGMSRLRQTVQAARERKRRESRPQGRRIRGLPGRPHRAPGGRGWAVPFPTIDPQTVLRSAKALDRYGPDFSYSHYLVLKRLPTVAGLAAGVTAGITLAQFPPTRKLLLKLKDPGDGPSPERRAESWFNVRFDGHSNGTRIVTEVSGGDPGYTETSKMLAESGLCLAHDDVPDSAGQVTPAAAMGQPLIDRLQRAGIQFKTVEAP